MKVTVRAVSALVAVTGIMLVVLFVPSKSTSWPEIRIAVSETPLSAPLIIAGSNGYFQKHDLKIKLIKARGGVNCMQMLLNDEVDLATTSDSVVMFTRFERDDFGVLTSFAESDNDVKILTLAASPDSPSPALENGRAGVVIDSASEFFLDAYMAMEGMNTRGIEKRGYQPTNWARRCFAKRWIILPCGSHTATCCRVITLTEYSVMKPAVSITSTSCSATEPMKTARAPLTGK